MTAPDWYESSLAKIRSGEARVAIIGCGYVGLTLAVDLARAGIRILGIETDEIRAKELQAGSNPVPDVYIPEGELVDLCDSGRLAFATALEETCDAYVICVPTPLKDGSPDLRFIETAAESAAGRLARGQLVILESTTYPGTTEELLEPILREGSGLHPPADYALAYSPERINPGDRLWGLRNTPKVVGGLTPEATELAGALYGHVCDSVHHVSSPRSAEITKLFENTYREVNIALANEMAVVCHDFDIDPWEVLEAAATKPFGFTPFRPGPGVGGHCLAPGERLYVRSSRGVRVMRAEELWAEHARHEAITRAGGTDVIAPPRTVVAAFDRGIGTWNAVTLLGRRMYRGDLVTLGLRGGRRVSVTTDHRMLVHESGALRTKLASDVEVGDLVPIWRGDEEWDAVLNPRVDLMEALATDISTDTGTDKKGIGVRCTWGDWRPWRAEIRSVLGASATDEVIRHGRLPLAALRELEQKGHLAISHDDLVLCTGRGNSARSIPAVIELTPDVARLIGYYLAEGCVTGSPTSRTVFTFHRDETETMADLTKIFGSLGLSWSVYEDKKWRTTQIKVGNRLFARLLRDVLGCGANSYDARIPPQLLGASAVHRWELLSGLLRGDGSVYTDGRERNYRKGSREYRSIFRNAEVGYFSVSERLAEEVEHLFLSLGYVPSLRRLPDRDGWLLRIHGSQDLDRLAELFCDRKGRRLHAHLETLKTKRRRSRSYERIDDLHLAPVISIDRIPYDGPVYSLETSPSHTFATSHGIVVRNCVPVDPQYLAWRVRGKVGRQFRLLETASDINQRMPVYVAQRAGEILNDHGMALRGARILLLGIAYKGGSGDIRESPALRVAKRLTALGADVGYHDPFVDTVVIDDRTYESQALDDSLVERSDIVIVLTDHPDVDYARVLERAKCLYDTRGVTAGWPSEPNKLYRA